MLWHDGKFFHLSEYLLIEAGNIIILFCNQNFLSFKFTLSGFTSRCKAPHLKQKSVKNLDVVNYNVSNPTYRLLLLPQNFFLPPLKWIVQYY